MGEWRARRTDDEVSQLLLVISLLSSKEETITKSFWILASLTTAFACISDNVWLLLV